MRPSFPENDRIPPSNRLLIATLSYFHLRTIGVASRYASVCLSQNRRITVDQSRFSNLSADYNDFLFATVCEDANGTQLTVLSALARIDVDPWEEAGRLAAMPSADAARALISMLDHACGKNNDVAEAEATATRLVQLLPRSGSSAAVGLAPMATAGAMKDPLQSYKASLKSYWWVWIGLAVVVSFITPRPDAATNPTMAQTALHEPTRSAAPEPSIAGAAPAVVDNNPVPLPAAEGVPSATPSVAPNPMAYSR
jgi:hypothetical protein